MDDMGDKDGIDDFREMYPNAYTVFVLAMRVGLGYAACQAYNKSVKHDEIYTKAEQLADVNKNGETSREEWEYVCLISGIKQPESYKDLENSDLEKIIKIFE